MVCDKCGRDIKTGSTIYMNEKFAPNKVFCSSDCLNEHLKDNCLDLILEVIDEDYGSTAEKESDNPYDNFGVNPRDF